MKKYIALLTIFAITLLLSSCNTGENQKAADTGPLHFEATIESLQQYECPEWFRDAKFGIYMHWGVYSVAEMGEWYARKLYMEETPEYEHHVKTYGHPSEFGYKDFIPLW
ncbi:MAG: alpha-L-fucosidase, partial [Bacteroidetes bacterium]|nr:alpha-L-fucosidase [Bacteroidota bacterium]